MTYTLRKLRFWEWKLLMAKWQGVNTKDYNAVMAASRDDAYPHYTGIQQWPAEPTFRQHELFICLQIARYSELNYPFHRGMVEHELGTPPPWIRVLNLGTTALPKLVRGCRKYRGGTVGHVSYNHLNH